jgi:hypothetical protein
MTAIVELPPDGSPDIRVAVSVVDGHEPLMSVGFLGKRRARRALCRPYSRGATNQSYCSR